MQTTPCSPAGARGGSGVKGGFNVVSGAETTESTPRLALINLPAPGRLHGPRSVTPPSGGGNAHPGRCLGKRGARCE